MKSFQFYMFLSLFSCRRKIGIKDKIQIKVLTISNLCKMFWIHQGVSYVIQAFFNLSCFKSNESFFSEFYLLSKLNNEKLWIQIKVFTISNLCKMFWIHQGVAYVIQAFFNLSCFKFDKMKLGVLIDFHNCTILNFNSTFHTSFIFCLFNTFSFFFKGFIAGKILKNHIYISNFLNFYPPKFYFRILISYLEF